MGRETLSGTAFVEETLPQKKRKLMLLPTCSWCLVALRVPWDNAADLTSGPYETGDASLPLQIGRDGNSGSSARVFEEAARLTLPPRTRPHAAAAPVGGFQRPLPLGGSRVMWLKWETVRVLSDSEIRLPGASHCCHFSCGSETCVHFSISRIRCNTYKRISIFQLSLPKIELNWKKKHNCC